MEQARESIIVSAVRKFCNSFAAVIGIVVGVVLVAVILMMFATPDMLPPKSHLSIAADANGKRELLPHTAPVILKLDIHGVIGQKELTAEKMQNVLWDSQEGMLKNRVHAVLLSINTPGGAADDADGIYRALMAYKKKYQVPIYVFVDGLCASGGMYIAAAADKIYATDTSIIGSVGVILGPLFNFSGLMDRYGVQAMSVTRGKDKDMMSSFRPWQPGEDQNLQNITAALYDRFVSIVLQGRKEMTREKLVDVYGAQIYVAETAKELGYIDVANADYAQAVAELVQAAQLPEVYQVMSLMPVRPFLSELAESKLSLFRSLFFGPYSELNGRFLYLYQPSL
jgi:signal peptide peptidase SppA